MPILKDIFTRRTVVDWVEATRKYGIPSAPVLSIAGAPDDDQTRGREMVLKRITRRWAACRACVSKEQTSCGDVAGRARVRRREQRIR